MKLPLLYILLGLLCHFAYAQSPIINTQASLQSTVCYNTTAVITANVSDAETYEVQFQNELGNFVLYNGGSGNVSSDNIYINLPNYTANLTLRVKFNNTDGSVTSSNFLAMAQPSPLQVQPQNQTQCYDGDVYFYVDNLNTSDYSFQWQMSNDGSQGSFTNRTTTTKYKDVTTHALKLVKIKTSDNDYFRCVVTHITSGCSVTSNGATLSINRVSIVIPTATNPFCEGDTVTFSPTAISGTVNSHTWEVFDNGSNLLSGYDFDNVSENSFIINGVPKVLYEVKLTAEFTNSLMNLDGRLTAGTCETFHLRDSYVIDPKPAGPSAMVADSVCGAGTMALGVTDARADWDWAASKYGTALSTSSMYNTPNLSSSAYYYATYTDGNGCTSIPDSVLAKVNSLPTVTLGIVDEICPGSSSFDIPYTDLSDGNYLFSLVKSSGSIGFDDISDANLNTSPLVIPLTGNLLNGDNSFKFNLQHTITECISEDLTVNMRVKKPTVIVTDPSSVVICENSSYTFSVAGDGEGLISYQWFFNIDSIIGAQSANLIISNAQLSADGNYHCIATAECGAVQSATATLTINPKTRIIVQPVNTETCLGSDATFAIEATGTGVLHYQWKKNNMDIGTDSVAVNLESVSLADNEAKITCLVTGDCGDSLSMEATLTVLALPIAPAVIDTGYCINSTASVLTATLLTDHAVNWYGLFDPSGLGVATPPTPATDVVGKFEFFVTQIDLKNCESEKASLMVTISPELSASITTNISTICPGGILNRSALASVIPSGGSGFLDYQWKKVGVNIDGETSTEYSVMDDAFYAVLVKSGYCEVEKSINVNLAIFDGTAPIVNSMDGTGPFEECRGSDFELTATSDSETDFYWYNSPTSAFSILNSDVLRVTNLQSTITYYVAAHKNIGLLTCETERQSAQINIIPKLAINATITPISCPGVTDGAIVLVPNPTTASFEYKFDGSSAFSSTSIFENLAAGTYPFQLKNTKGCLADTTLIVGTVSAPVFTTQPDDATNCDGNLVNFVVETDNLYTIEWQKMLTEGIWENIANENDLNLRVTNVGSSTNPNGTFYRAKASSGSCFTYSETAKLNVNDFTSLLDNQSVCSANVVILSPPSSIGQIESYLWQKKVGSSGTYVDVQDSTLPDYVIDLATASDSNNYYRVKVAFLKEGSSTCLKTSDEAILAVTTVSQNTVLTGNLVICNGETTTLKASGCNGDVVWSNDEIGDSISVSPSINTVYSAICKIGECIENAQNSLEVSVKPGINSPEILVTNALFCFGDSAVFTAIFCSEQILWSNNTSENPLIIKEIGAESYSAKCIANGCTSAPSISVDVTGYPELRAGEIEVRLDTNCAGFNPSTISSKANPSGGKGTLTIRWEMSENCAALEPIWVLVSAANANAFNPAALQKTTCYRRKVADDCTDAYSNISTIHIEDDPTVTVDSDKNTICSNETFTLTATPIGGVGECTTTWQKNLNSSASGSSFWGNIVGSDLINTLFNIDNPETETASIYFRAIYDCSLSSCNKATSEAIEIQVLPSSEVKLNFTDSTVCIGNTVNIVATNCGGNLMWSDGSTDFTKEVIVTSSASYTATCSSLCGTYTATVNINAIPGIVPPVNSTPISAIQPAILLFSATGKNLKWYRSATIDTTLDNVPMKSEIGQYSYWVSQSNNLCESPRLKVSAVVYSPLTILAEPYNAYKCEGNSVKFSVEAIGAGKLFYQWQRKRPGETDFVNLSNEDDGIFFAQQPWLSVSAIHDKDNPNQSLFRCQITDSLSVVYTEIRTLNANVINRTLPNLDACVGQNFNIDLSHYVELVGSIFGYQWQKRDDTEGKWKDLAPDFHVSGTQTSILKFHDLNYLYQGKYRCQIFFNTGGVSCIESTDQTYLTVGDYPNTPPTLEVDYCQGETTKLLNVNLTPNRDIWYLSNADDAIGTSKSPKPSSDSAGVFVYWFSAVSPDKCSSPKSLYVVNVHPTPEMPGNQTPEYVMDDDTLVFDAYGSTLNWYKTSRTRTFQNTRPAYTEIDDYKFYVTQVSEFGCESEKLLIEASIYGTLGFKTTLENKADCDGNGVRFISNGKGIEPLTYVWEKRLPGDSLFYVLEDETNKDLSVTNIGTATNPHETEFKVTVTDSTGSKTSNSAFLSVNEINGKISSQWLCEGDSWRVNIESLEIQGEVNQYELQYQEGTSWITLDSAYQVDSNWVKNSLSFFKDKDDTLKNLDFRLRVVFNAENNGTCARSTNEFNFKREERSLPFGNYSEEVCQYSSIDLLGIDSTYFTFFAKSRDSSQLFKVRENFTDSAGIFQYFFAVQDTITGCLSTKDTLVLTVLPADSVKLGVSSYAFCTEDTSSLFVLDDVSSYTWYLNDSSRTALGDSLFIDQRSKADSSFWFEAVYESGCKSPLEQLFISIESCKTSELGNISGEVKTEEEKFVSCVTYPNPFKTDEELDFSTQNLIINEISIYDMAGFKVHHEFRNEMKNYQKLKLNSDLKAGIYIFKVLDLYGNHCEFKMVKSL